MLAKDGFKVIVPIFAVTFMLCILVWLFPVLLLRILLVLSIAFFLFSLYFFRDPERTAAADENVLISPADGEIVKIENVDDPFVGKGWRISIFMSVFSVHVNRMIAAGTVKDTHYRKGKFLPAFKPEVLFENEQNTVMVEGERIRFTLTQIAGMIARRIVTRVEIGQAFRRGERFGMIMFGSRVDIVVPESVILKVELQQRVKAGETEIGVIE